MPSLTHALRIMVRSSSVASVSMLCSSRMGLLGGVRSYIQTLPEKLRMIQPAME